MAEAASFGVFLAPQFWQGGGLLHGPKGGIAVASAPSNQLRLGCLVMSGLAGVLGGLLSIVIVVAIRGRDPSPELNRADFETAQQLWKQAGPPSYNIAVRVVGPQPAVYRVEVRSGEVISASIDGRPLKQRRTLDTWSVPGMFGTMERDLAHVEEWASGRAVRGTPQLTLRATFHPTYGYPQRFRRTEWGADRDMVWEVIEFVIPDS